MPFCQCFKSNLPLVCVCWAVNNSETMKFLDLINRFDFNQHINSYTRFDPRTGSQKLIDVVITNYHDNSINTSSSPISQALSDHNLINAQFQMQSLKTETKYIKFRDYNNKFSYFNHMSSKRGRDFWSDARRLNLLGKANN